MQFCLVHAALIVAAAVTAADFVSSAAGDDGSYNAATTKTPLQPDVL
jgi:hypothetical protein